MEIKVSENVRPGGSYSTVFQANRETYGLNNPADKRFSFGPGFGRTEVILTGFYSRAGKQLRIEWSIGRSEGAENWLVNTPEVSWAINEIGKRLEAANAGLSLSGLTTWLLTENVEEPRGLLEMAEAGVGKVSGAVSGAFGSIAKPVFLIGGILAVGLAVGLSKSKAEL